MHIRPQCLLRSLATGSFSGSSACRLHAMQRVHRHAPLRGTKALSLHFTGEVAIITINAGENWFVPDLTDDFMPLLDEVERIPDCKGLITTGLGKFYSNGISSTAVCGMNAQTKQKFMRATRLLLERILFFPMPTLAAINGHSFGFGAIFAFTHDIRTMRADRGWICFNEVRVGAQLADYMMPLLREKIGTGQILSDCLVLGHKFTADTALKNGLVHAVAPENRLIRESEGLLKAFCGETGYSRESLVNTKKQVYKTIYDAINAEDDTYDFFALMPKL